MHVPGFSASSEGAGAVCSSSLDILRISAKKWEKRQSHANPNGSEVLCNLDSDNDLIYRL